MIKNKIVKITIVFLLLFASCKSESKETEATDIVFKNVNIISMTSNEIQENKSVFISNGVIQEIGDYSDISIAKSSQVIDGKGKFLTPGFSDMHVHTYDEEENSLFLVNGITTIRNMWGNPEHLRYRDNIRNGSVLAPELFTTGPLTDGKGAYWKWSHVLIDVDKVEEYVTKIKEDGYDYIKVYDKLSKEVFFKIMEVAKEHDIPVVGHVPKKVDIKDAISSSLYSIEHFMGYNLRLYRIEDLAEVIELTVESGIWNCPTLIVKKQYEELLNRKSNSELFSLESIPQLKYVSKENLDMWNSAFGWRSGFKEAKEFLNILYDKGANIVTGSDMGNPYVIAGFSLHDEFELMNESGLTPYEVLLTTTVNPAKMLGIEGRAGTIEVGKDADLVLLDKNPLLDIKNTRTISGVMTKGRWLDKSKLEEMLKEVEESYSKK